MLAITKFRDFVEYRFALEERAALAANSEGKALVGVAWSRLRGGLPDYFRLSFDHWCCLWTLSLPDFDELKALNSFIDNRRPLPFAQALPGAPSFTLQLPPIAYRIGFFALQSAMIGAGLLLALSIGVLLVQWSCGRQPSQMVIVSAFAV